MSNQEEVSVRDAKIKELEDAGILESEWLSDKALDAIGKLTDDQIDVLKTIARDVSLNAFINARGPQRARKRV